MSATTRVAGSISVMLNFGSLFDILRSNKLESASYNSSQNVLDDEPVVIRTSGMLPLMLLSNNVSLINIWFSFRHFTSKMPLDCI